MRRSNLSSLTVRTISTTGRYADGGNLFLQVSKQGGTKSWLFRYMRNGRARAMGLGSAQDVTLAKARQLAALCRAQLADGTDPIESRKSARRQAQLEAARAITFRHCAENYIAAHKAGWKSLKHLEQWEQSLKKHVYPKLGEVAVAAIDTGLVMQVLEPIWSKRPQTANRLRGRIERVLSWAKVRGYRTGDNPALWRGHLDQLLPRTRKVSAVKHHPALAYQEVNSFLSNLRQQQWLAAPCLEFLILTATRSGEARGARWAEINFESKTWTIPAQRMKGNREHRVPLCDRVLEILQCLPRLKDDSLIFAGGRLNRPLDDRTLTQALGRLKYPHITVHGFRSSFRDWAAEQTNYPREVAEAALAHVNVDRVEAAYRRSDLFEKRRRLMDEWAKFCRRPPSTNAQLIPLHDATHG